MRALMMSILVVVSAVAPALAETELVVLGPAGDPANADVKSVAAVLDRGEAGPRNTRGVDAACATDATCLATAGSELGARRVLGVIVKPRAKGQVVVEVVFVDVVSKEVLARKDIAVAAAKVGKDLCPALKKLADDAPVERAKALFAMGNQHYNLGEFTQALEAYKLAYRIKPLPAFLFNIAQCHRKLGQHREAVAMYQSYLVGVPDASNKALVESLIGESQAELVADEQKEAAQLEAERVAAEKKRAEDMRLAKEADARAAAERAKAEQARIAEERELYDRHPARVWAYVGGGIGVAALVAGGVFGVRAKDAQASFDDAGCGDNSQLLTQTELATCRSDRDRGEQAALMSNVFLVGGGVLLATSALVFLIDPGNVERPTQSRAQLRVTPTSIQAVIRW